MKSSRFCIVLLIFSFVIYANSQPHKDNPSCTCNEYVCYCEMQMPVDDESSSSTLNLVINSDGVYGSLLDTNAKETTIYAPIDMLTKGFCSESFKKILMERDDPNQESIANMFQELCATMEDALNDNENIKLFLFKFNAEFNFPKNRQQVVQISGPSGCKMC